MTSTRQSFEKRVGRISLEISQPYPRCVHLSFMHESTVGEVTRFPTMTTQDMSDLHYALTAAIKWFDDLDEVK